MHNSLKTCSCCKRELSYIAFSKHPYNKDGYQTQCKDCKSKNMRASNLILRLDALDAYGGRVCAICGEIFIEFLTIDHINGNNVKSTNRASDKLYRWLKKNKYPDGYRVLCFNCNLAHGKTKRINKLTNTIFTKKFNAFFCTKCDEIKYEHEFHKNKTKKSGYDSQCKDCVNAASTERRNKLKITIFNHYGTKCACCGEDNIEHLTIDHVNGGGNKHRKLINRPFYRWLQKNNFPTGYRTLCMNCNYSYGCYRYCPHTHPPMGNNLGLR